MDMKRRSFLGAMLGVAGAAAVGELPELVAAEKSGFSGASDGLPSGPVGPTGIYLEPGQSVQQAIDLVKSYGGGCVFFKPGTYISGQQIVIPEGVQLVGDGDLTIADCHIMAATPIFLGGLRNRVMNCYLEAQGKLEYFFEVQMEKGDAFFGNVLFRIRESIEKPFRECLELIRGRPS